ncbi:MAG: tetrahydromethanopterin S-methyltransferase subunit H [Candidatus Bathyarchaeota archaeon]|nr:tetrahydromethanopterin S-methyltransferase subunit H [Candidatus Bathyarchaeota archaeon]
MQFEKEQKVYEISGVRIGGQLGENPTAMIGSIFYKGDKIVKDEKTGTFDRGRAEELIARLEEISDRTGLPAMLDVVCSESQVAEKYLEFAADATNMPILIDAVSEEAGLRGIECARELRIIERTIFNSLNPETKQQIYDKIKNVALESAIALTYSTSAIISSKERVKLLDTLIPRAEGAGIKNILVDTVVMDIATLGLACKAIYEIKSKFGYPAGCGAHNAVESWRALKKKKDKMLTAVCSSIVNGLPIAIGADFVLYGPINAAEYMFPAISVIDASYGQVLMEEGKRPSPTHPRFKIARLY